MAITKSTTHRIVELGCPGHFICADQCRWRRHTQIGRRYRVSTVGDLYYTHEPDKRQTLGAAKDSFFESMVFKTGGLLQDVDGCGCHAIREWTEIECVRYATAGKAQAGHEALIQKYLQEIR